ncbi:MAG: DUF3127 domain-containing protein [Epsilonproteobacteria bacterium]|nr:DUF3127 domain-containing protein [Campylobacterota bacterium]
MNITAKLTQLLPLQTGMGKNGQWRKQDIIVETDNQYPKKICISIWGDKINETQLQIGNVLDISFELESREFNNKWYTDIKALKIVTVVTNIPEIVNGEDIKSDFLQDDDDILPF